MATPPLTEQALERYVREAVAKRHVHGFVIDVRRDGRSMVLAAGNLQPESRFFAASVTKLFVTTAILKLEEAGTLALDDAIDTHLPGELVDGLHVLDGVDRSRSITVWHLLSNTSGIPDYFDTATMQRLLANHDEPWGLAPAVAAAKAKRPRFVPGRRAQYSDTNFQLLGAIIERRAKAPLKQVFDDVAIGPLGLADTYLYEGGPDDRLVPIFYKDRALELPRYLASIGAEGGLVSTARDLGTFIEAFFGGRLFDAARLERHDRWRLVFGPGLFFYGGGIIMQPTSPLRLRRGILGHWGHSGAFAFFDPRTRTHLAGTVNQFVGHNVAARVMIRVLNHVLEPARGSGALSQRHYLSRPHHAGAGSHGAGAGSHEDRRVAAWPGRGPRVRS